MPALPLLWDVPLKCRCLSVTRFFPVQELENVRFDLTFSPPYFFLPVMLDDLDIWSFPLCLVLPDAFLGRWLLLLAVDSKLVLLNDPLFRRRPFLRGRPLLLRVLADRLLGRWLFLRWSVLSLLLAKELVLDVLGVFGVFLLLDIFRLEDGYRSARAMYVRFVFTVYETVEITSVMMESSDACLPLFVVFFLATTSVGEFCSIQARDVVTVTVAFIFWPTSVFLVLLCRGETVI